MLSRSTIKTGAGRITTTSDSVKATELYNTAKELIPILPKDKGTQLLIHQAIDMFNANASKRGKLTEILVHNYVVHPTFSEDLFPELNI